MGRVRNIALHLWLSKDEKEMLHKISQASELTYTEILVNWIKKDYEKLIQK